MIVLEILLAYYLLGMICIKLSVDSLIKSGNLPLVKDLSNEQYLFIVLIGGAIWIPLLIHIIISGISSGELKKYLEEDEKEEQENKK